MTTRRPPHRSPRPRPLTRRDFLGVAGLSALVGGMACVGGTFGYLVLDRLARRSTPTPAPPTVPPDRVKLIDRPPIISRAEWGARPVDHTAVYEFDFFSATNAEGWLEYTGDLRDIYRTVVVHHSVEYETDDVTTMRIVQDLHMDDNGWADIGYHFGVGQAGGVYEGRALNARGTHVEGYNTGSVGVVLLGDFEIDFPSAVQVEAARRLIDWLALRLELTHLAGHRDFNPTTQCPGAHLYPMLASLALSAGLTLGTGGYLPPDPLATASP